MPRRPASRDQLVEVLERAERRVHGGEVGDVVAPVLVRRGHRRIEPDAVDPQPFEVVEVRDHAAQIADPVAVGVRERARIDLVQHAVAPPHRLAPLGHGGAAYAPPGFDSPARMEPLPQRCPSEEDGVTTIARVAALAGVGVGTVSRVLNDSGAVSASTRRRVEEAIDALGYEPSAAARALSTGRTMSIGVVAPFLTKSSVVERLRGVARRVADADYRLLLFDVERPDRLYDSVGSFAVNGRVDGLLVVSLALPEDFRAGSVPIVLVDRESDRPPERPHRRRGRRPARGRAPARARPHAHRLRRRHRGEPVRLRLQRAPPPRLRGGAARRRRDDRPGARADRAPRP